MKNNFVKAFISAVTATTFVWILNLLTTRLIGMFSPMQLSSIPLRIIIFAIGVFATFISVLIATILSGFIFGSQNTNISRIALLSIGTAILRLLLFFFIPNVHHLISTIITFSIFYICILIGTKVFDIWKQSWHFLNIMVK